MKTTVIIAFVIIPMALMCSSQALGQETATVVIYTQANFLRHHTAHVWMDGQELVSLASQSVFTTQVPVGDRKLEIKRWTKPQTFTLEAGHTYYFEYKNTPEDFTYFVMNVPSLNLTPHELAQPIIGHLKTQTTPQP